MKNFPECKELSTTLLTKVRKKAKIRNHYNQAPHPTQVTTWESDKTIKHHIQESQEASSYPAGEHKAAVVNRQENMTNINPQKKHRLGTVSKNL